MDPIAAYRKQQERLGTAHVEKTTAQMREANPRWATIFTRMDTSNDGLLQIDEVSKGFKQILGAGSEVPHHHILKVFENVMKENAGTDNDGLDFKQFCKLAQTVSAYMMDYPKWAQAEAAIELEQEKRKAEAEKAAKAKEAPDIYKLLGLKKSPDMQETENRKKRALTNAICRRNTIGEGQPTRSTAALAGSSIVQSGSKVGPESSGSGPSSPPMGPASSVPSDGLVGRSILRGSAPDPYNPALFRAARNFSNLKRAQCSVESAASAETEDPPEPQSPTKKLRDMWERFSISSARGRTQRQLGDVRQIHLPDFLPQIRALGKRNAGCNSLRFSPDGSQLAGGFFDGGVRIFDVDKAAESHCMNLPKFKGGSVKSAEERERDVAMRAAEAGELSPAGYAAAMTVNEDVDIKTVMKKWEPVTNIRWQPSSGRIGVVASVDTNGTLMLWDAPRNKETRLPQCLASVETGSALTSVMFNCDGTVVAAAGAERVIKLYDAEVDMGKGSLTPTLTLGTKIDFGGKITGHSLKIVSLCADPTNPNVYASAGLDRHVLIWDTRAGNSPQNHIFGVEMAGDAMDMSRDGFSVLCGSHRSKNPLEIYDLRVTEDSKPTTSYSWRGNEERSEGGGRWTTCLLFGANWDEWENKTIVAAGENENLARVYDRSADEGDPLRIIGTVRGKAQAFWSAAISRDGSSAAFGAADGAVCLVDIKRR